MPPEVQPWHFTELLNPDYNRVDLVKEGANSQAAIKLFKHRGGVQMNFEEILKGLKPEHAKGITDHIDSIVKAKDDEISVVEKAKKDAEEALKAADIAKSTSEQSEEEIIKSIKDPAVRALMETQLAKTKAAEAQVQKMHNETVEKEAIAKSIEVDGIGADQDTLVGLYKSLTTTDVALRDTVFGVLKSAKALVAEGSVTSEIGKSAPQAGSVLTEDAAWAALESAASEIAKSRNISQSHAITAVMKEQPELYNAYTRAQAGK